MFASETDAAKTSDESKPNAMTIRKQNIDYKTYSGRNVSNHFLNALIGIYNTFCR